MDTSRRIGSSAPAHLKRRGHPVSPGVAIGVVTPHTYARIAVHEEEITAECVEAEIQRFRLALNRSREEVAFLRQSVAQELGEDSARIFDAQLLFFEDVMVVDATIRDIAGERKNAASLFRRNVNRMVETLEDADSAYLRQRGDDFKDAKRRVLRHLLEVAHDGQPGRAGSILVAGDLAPSEAAALDPTTIQGLVTEGGAVTSHAAIMARAKGIPAVVGVSGVVRAAREGDTMALDGTTGVVELNPPASRLEDFRRLQVEFRDHEQSLIRLREERAVTTDGRVIDLAANIESPADVERVLERGAGGVGLYRTEFFYVDRAHMPSEDEQAEAYGTVAERLHPRSVIIRTMDVGGDKVASFLGTGPQTNPFLGWRGIRFSLERRDVFRTQLRAIYRASARGNVRIMFPMIASVEELREARAVASEAREEVAGRKVALADRVEIGMMVETPAAVILADILARECDFFSVGSNDLIQYTLAVDRTNPKIAHLYEPLHPAIVRSLQVVVEAARRHGIWVGLCGEMASDPLAVLLLVGLGFDELSVTPVLVPEVKEVVRAISYAEAREAVNAALALETGVEVRAMLRERIGGRLSKSLLP